MSRAATIIVHCLSLYTDRIGGFAVFLLFFILKAVPHGTERLLSLFRTFPAHSFVLFWCCGFPLAKDSGRSAVTHTQTHTDTHTQHHSFCDARSNDLIRDVEQKEQYDIHPSALLPLSTCSKRKGKDSVVVFVVVVILASGRVSSFRPTIFFADGSILLISFLVLHR